LAAGATAIYTSQPVNASVHAPASALASSRCDRGLLEQRVQRRALPRGARSHELPRIRLGPHRGRGQCVRRAVPRRHVRGPARGRHDPQRVEPRLRGGVQSGRGGKRGRVPALPESRYVRGNRGARPRHRGAREPVACAHGDSRPAARRRTGPHASHVRPVFDGAAHLQSGDRPQPARARVVPRVSHDRLGSRRDSPSRLRVRRLPAHAARRVRRARRLRCPVRGVPGRRGSRAARPAARMGYVLHGRAHGLSRRRMGHRPRARPALVTCLAESPRLRLEALRPRGRLRRGSDGTGPGARCARRASPEAPLRPPADRHRQRVRAALENAGSRSPGMAHSDLPPRHGCYNDAFSRGLARAAG
jgi:hypothetical protein